MRFVGTTMRVAARSWINSCNGRGQLCPDTAAHAVATQPSPSVSADVRQAYRGEAAAKVLFGFCGPGVREGEPGALVRTDACTRLSAEEIL